MSTSAVTPASRQLSVAEFAATIKRKYPTYANVPDETLARAIVAKYPVYAARVRFDDAGTATAGAKREVAGMDAAPRFGSQAWARSKAYTWADRLLPLLPAAGASAGGMVLSESGPGAVAGAFAGGMAGEAARQELTRMIFDRDPEHMEPMPQKGDEIGAAVRQGGLGALSEVGGRAAAKAIQTVAAPFVAAAKSAIGTGAGRAIRMLPGETPGHPLANKVAALIGHLPGGAGLISRFREMQEADADRYFANRVAELSADHASSQSTGKAVQQYVKGGDYQRAVRGLPGEPAAPAGTVAAPDPYPQQLAEHEAARQQATEALGVRPVSGELTGTEAQGHARRMYASIERGQQAAREEAERVLRQTEAEELAAHHARTAEHQASLDAASRTFPRPAATPEALGQNVRAAVERARQSAVEEQSRLFNEARREMGIPENTYLSAEEFDRRLAAHSEAPSPEETTQALHRMKPAPEPRRGPATRAGAALAAARRHTAEGFEAFENPLVKRILSPNTPAERIGDVVSKAGLEDVRRLNALLPPEVRRQLGDAVLHDVLGAATDPATGRIAAGKLQKELAAIGEERGALLFGEPRWQELGQKARSLAMLESAAPAAPARAARSVLPAAPAHPLQANRLMVSVARTRAPEAIPSLLRRASLADLREMAQHLPPDAMRGLADSLLHTTTLGATDRASGRILGGKLLRELDSIGEERGRVIFGEMRWSQIRGAAERLAELDRTAPMRGADALPDSPALRALIGRGKPAEIAARLRTATPETLRLYARSVPEAARRQIGEALARDIARASGDPATGRIASGKWLANLRQIGDERGPLLFGDARWEHFHRIGRRLAGMEAHGPGAAAGTELARSIARARPEQVHRAFAEASLDDLATMKRQMPATLWRKAAADVLESAVNGSRHAQTQAIEARPLATFLKQLGPERGRLIFGDQYAAVTRGSALLNQILTEGEGAGRMHMVAKGLIAVGALANLALLRASALNAGEALVGEAAVIRLIAAALTHPQFSATTLRLLEHAARWTPRAAMAAGDYALRPQTAPLPEPVTIASP